jgi:hypothetical protein
VKNKKEKNVRMEKMSGDEYTWWGNASSVVSIPGWPIKQFFSLFAGL